MDQRQISLGSRAEQRLHGLLAEANRISSMLNTVLGADRFPVKVDELALEYSRQCFSDSPIDRVAVLADAYEHQKERGWSDAERQNWIREVLQAPIDLRGFSTTYRNALNDLWFPVPEYPRVFHGKHAQVELTEDGYEITSERPGKVDGGDSSRPFVIIVSLLDVDDGQLRGARRTLLRQLERAAEEDATVRWYAYGRAKLAGERFELAFDGANIGDLFVKLQKNS